GSHHAAHVGGTGGAATSRLAGDSHPSLQRALGIGSDGAVSAGAAGWIYSKTLHQRAVAGASGSGIARTEVSFPASNRNLWRQSSGFMATAVAALALGIGSSSS